MSYLPYDHHRDEEEKVPEPVGGNSIPRNIPETGSEQSSADIKEELENTNLTYQVTAAETITSPEHILYLINCLNQLRQLAITNQ